MRLLLENWEKTPIEKVLHGRRILFYNKSLFRTYAFTWMILALFPQNYTKPRFMHCFSGLSK